MVQYTVEAVTIVTIVVIGIILAIYLIILKKNGWLGGNSDFYRCPNQKCKRIFKKPIELKDLSETPARVYPACPECGVDLGSILPSYVEKKSQTKISTLFQKKKITYTEKKVKNEKVEEPKQVKHLEPKPIEKAPVERLQKSKQKTKVTDDSRCKHYFGYLGQREEQEEIPEACLECLQITDCMLSNYHRSEDSIKEIKKWYLSKPGIR